jgi:beta-glucosidase
MKRNRKSKKISRRNFLKVALTATGGLAVARCSRGGSASVPTSVTAQLPSATATVGATATPSLPIYADPSRSIEERVNDLVGRMTLAEKISQMGSEAAEIKRLGIAQYNWWNEALHGVARDGIATVFPQVIGLAATWNTDLIHQMAVAISDEGRAKHHDSIRNGSHDLYTGLTYFCPNVNIFRDPRWGRGQETYGEDPYLTSRLAVNFIRGMQGDDPRYLKTVATAKHFAVHSGPEKDRHSFNAVVSQSDLRMTYLPAFQACITEAKSYSIMGAYNRVNGEACNASPTLLQKILRGEWGFEGYVVADCGAVDDIFLYHSLANSPEEAAAMAVKAGCDLECGCTFGIACDFGNLHRAVDKGMITEDDITRAVKRLFTARFLLGEFDPDGQVSYAQIPMSVVDSAEHRSLALEAARQSLVLLKNANHVLPLDKDSLKSIAVIGPNADDTLVLNGNYTGTPAEPVTVLAGIRALASPETKVNYAPGSGILDRVENGVQDAVQAAYASQVAVVVAGLSQQLEGEEGQREGNPPGISSRGDRTTLDLPPAQEELLEAVVKTGKPVILVLLNGSAVSINWADAHVPAILEAWYPGQAGGTAVAEAIFGLTNPGGRLPVTFYQSASDLPDFKDYNMKNHTYRYFTGKPLYPFGYGLSYTTFAYDNLQINPATVKQGDSVSVKADVENSGSRPGDEVVQLYLKDEDSSLPVPGLQLQGFARVRLAPAEKQTVEFTITAAQMSAADENGKWVLEPGAFKVWVGGRQPDLKVGAQSANVLEGEFIVQA